MNSVTESSARKSIVGNDVAAAIIAGLIAGCAYLLAQMSFAATVQHGAGWEPLQRIAAMLLGPDAEPPPAEVSVSIVGIAALIHFPLAGVYGRMVAWSVRRVDRRWLALVGLACGLAIYALDFGLIAPLLFPWFLASRNGITAFDHALFGLVAAVCYGMLRPPATATSRP